MPFSINGGDCQRDLGFDPYFQAYRQTRSVRIFARNVYSEFESEDRVDMTCSRM